SFLPSSQACSSPPRSNLFFMCGSPRDQFRKPLTEVYNCLKPYLSFRSFGRANPVTNQRGLATGSILDRLFTACEGCDHFGQLLERRSLPGSDIVEPVGGFSFHGTDIGTAAI